jgi:hypothetical protein
MNAAGWPNFPAPLSLEMLDLPAAALQLAFLNRIPVSIRNFTSGIAYRKSSELRPPAGW